MLTTDPASPSSSQNGEPPSGPTAPPSGAEPTPALAEQLKALQFNKPSLNDGGGQGSRLLGTLAAVAVGVGLFLAKDTLFFTADATTVDAVTVESELSAAIVLDTSGFVLAENQVQIDPQVPGVLVELPVAEGDRVEKGALLGRIDDAELMIDVASAEAGVALAAARLAELKAGALPAEIKQAEASLDQARAREALALAELARAEELRDTISKKEYETTRASSLEAKALVRQNEQRLLMLNEGTRAEAIQAAEAEVQRAEAVLIKAKHWVARTRIHAPLAGVVVELKPRVGETIRPEALAGGFCVLADLSKLEIDVEVPERDLQKIQVGQPCRVEPEAFPDRFFAGRVARVLPMANRQRGVVQFRVVIDKPEGLLLPNMNCRVAVLKEGSPVDPDDRLFVPLAAVQLSDRGDYLFVKDGTQARIRPVTVGESTDRGVVITEGLFPGETVLLPDGGLSDGDEIHAVDVTVPEPTVPEPTVSEPTAAATTEDPALAG